MIGSLEQASLIRRSRKVGKGSTSIYGWCLITSCVAEGRKCVFKSRKSLRHSSLAADSEMDLRKKGDSALVQSNPSMESPSNDALVTHAATNRSCLMRMLFLWISGSGATYSLLIFCTASILSVRSCILLAAYSCLTGLDVESCPSTSAKESCKSVCSPAFKTVRTSIFLSRIWSLVSSSRIKLSCWSRWPNVSCLSALIGVEGNPITGNGRDCSPALDKMCLESAISWSVCKFLLWRSPARIWDQLCYICR